MSYGLAMVSMNYSAGGQQINKDRSSGPADDATPSRCSISFFRHLDLASLRQLKSATGHTLLPQEAPLPTGHCPAVAKSVSHLAVVVEAELTGWRPPMNTTATARR